MTSVHSGGLVKASKEAKNGYTEVTEVVSTGSSDHAQGWGAQDRNWDN